VLGRRQGQPGAPLRRPLSMNLVGLAFSGGGIRSATFNLGVLQALAKLNVLRHCDYLSTVSGGGYIGSWFTAWTYREGKNMNGGERVQETLEVREAGQASRPRILCEHRVAPRRMNGPQNHMEMAILEYRETATPAP
jgi:patatin-like phospholipase